MTDLPVPAGATPPDTMYAKPAAWVASGAGAQGNLFLTGRAGTGKTTLLRKFMAEAGDTAIVLAPTGVAAMNAVQQASGDGRILTGLLFLDPNSQNLNQNLKLAAKPLNELDKNELCPGSRVLNSINEGLR